VKKYDLQLEVSLPCSQKPAASPIMSSVIHSWQLQIQLFSTARLILMFDGNLQFLCRLYRMMTDVSCKILSHRSYLNMGCDRIFLNVIDTKVLGMYTMRMWIFTAGALSLLLHD